MNRLKLLLAGMALSAAPVLAEEPPMDQPLRPDQTAFRALYKELVETNTTHSAGSCTLAAERMAAHLKKAGFTDKDVSLFSVPEHPNEGGLTAQLAGTSKTEKAILLLGHLDVVEAKREDWTRDPFTLIEENNAICFMMEQKGLSRHDLEPAIGSRGRVAEILNRRRPLTLPMIRNLSKLLEVPADVLVQAYETRSAA